MKKTKELSGAELEVMQILWKNDGPMTVQDVCDQLKSSKWKYRTAAHEGKGRRRLRQGT